MVRRQRRDVRHRPSARFCPASTSAFDSPLKSPYADEYAIGTSRQLGDARHVARRRRLPHLSRLLQPARGSGDREGHRRARQQVRSASWSRTPTASKRRYSGLTMQATYRVGSGFDVGGNYTLSRTWGNLDGETAERGPSGRPCQRVSRSTQARRGTLPRVISQPTSAIARGCGRTYVGAAAAQAPVRSPSGCCSSLAPVCRTAPSGSSSRRTHRLRARNPGYLTPARRIGPSTTTSRHAMRSAPRRRYEPTCRSTTGTGSRRATRSRSCSFTANC